MDKLRIITCTILFLFLSYFSFGQIFQLFHLNDKVDLNDKYASEIIEVLKFRKGGIRYVKKFNNLNQVIEEIRVDLDGNFITELTYKFDPQTNLKIKETQKIKETNGLFTYRIEEYKYGKNGFLSHLLYLGVNGNTIKTAVVTNDNSGKPIKVETFNNDGSLWGSEIANYDYTENVVRYEQKDPNGLTIQSGFFTLSDKKKQSKSGYVYNDMGDLIRTPSQSIEIDYDQYNNWTSIKYYEVSNGVKELAQERFRTIKYIN